jgi:glycosyltransferase involved in cell wall biosynthesis
MPKISIIIPNYNHAAFLEQRIESVLCQTYQDFELILLDDASTDKSRETLLQYINHPKVQSYFNKTNSGSTFKQWNKGISYAQGEYVWIAESDDYADPLFLETLVGVLDSQPDIGVAYCQSCSVDQNNNVLAATYDFWTDDLDPERWKVNFGNSGIAECQNFLACKNTIPNASAVLFRRDIYLKIGRKNESYKVAGDWITWVEILFLSNIYFVSKPLNYFRVHSSNTSRNVQQLGLVVRESLRIIQTIWAEVSISEAAQHRSFNTLFQWWMTYLWSDCFSWKAELLTFLTILSTYRSLTLRKKACVGLVQFLTLKLRSHLKLGTRLKSSLGLNPE